MSICPKGKVSKSRRNKRRAQSWKIGIPDLVKCKNCGMLFLSHKMCRNCGSYNKKVIIDKNKNR
ncbi:MAG: 50S ribosomal protein L32 [Clostridiales bacterium]|jgi:large subunit ribosomal protein L32|nr:50S ribosomal protein L32 [Clostridiales bacterium]